MLAVVGYRCTECGREGSVSGEFAGKRGRCPGCQAWLTVSKGHCRSSASGTITPDEAGDPADAVLGAHLLELERVPLRLIDTLLGAFGVAGTLGLVTLLTEARLAKVACLVTLAAAALLWFLIESKAGLERLVLAERGLRLPGGQAVAWEDVLTFERGYHDAARWTVHTVHGSRRIPAGFCLTSGLHWAALLWVPTRERARETLHRRAARAIRVLDEAA